MNRSDERDNRRSPTARRVMRAAGCVAVGVVLAVAVAIGAMVWWLEVERPAGRKRLQRSAQANEVEKITRAIRTAAADGSLTDAEITALDAGGQWHIRRDLGDIRITRSVLAEGAYACWAFVVVPPLGPAAAVRSERVGNGLCAGETYDGRPATTAAGRAIEAPGGTGRSGGSTQAAVG
ncbi:hypothetical protein [Embleya sp. NPDC050493]|uniref:hypothetical protein n=1 Tax=Embleya sp. NPDC050493 TaxID=3363989 RepID=UPI0037B3FD2E